MSDIAIRVQNVSKRYRIGTKEETSDTFAGAIASFARSPMRNIRRLQRLSTFKQDENADDILWALKDVSFEVKQGEVIGVIGRNGAGKSTLLKILSRITYPTDGRIELHGRVSSLLEVGTGFHPELTGRENIYLNGTVLGMTKREIDAKFDAIVDFSGIEKFIDTPAKRYSSGMQVRLAFSVAAHLEPEILLVDEVLAVGDAEFQKKCLGKMDSIAREGRTILFVSHDMAAVRNLTEKTVYLLKGQVKEFAETPGVIDRYIEAALSQRSRSHNVSEYRRDKRIERDHWFTAIRVNGTSNSLPVIAMGEPIEVEIDVEAERDVRDVMVGGTIINGQGIRVVSFTSADVGVRYSLQRGCNTLIFRIHNPTLTPGLYLINLYMNLSYTAQATDVLLEYPLIEVQLAPEIVEWKHRPWGTTYWKEIHWAMRE